MISAPLVLTNVLNSVVPLLDLTHAAADLVVPLLDLTHAAADLAMSSTEVEDIVMVGKIIIVMFERVIAINMFSIYLFLCVGAGYFSPYHTSHLL